MRINPKSIIKKLRELGGKIRETARVLGISPGTVINWKKRQEKLGHLERFSTRPDKVRQSIIPDKEEKEIVEFREETRYGAIKIKKCLDLSHHHSTVHRLLKRNNLTPEMGKYRRPRYQPTKHMNVKNTTTLGKLQMDVKYVTPELSGLEHTCYLYAIMDIFSRYKQGVIFPLLDQSYAIEAVKHILPLLPIKPDFIQTDNGLEFQKRFHEFVTKRLGWNHHYIHKSNPNENAVIERSFRTDEDEFFDWRMEIPQNLANLNMQYQLYLNEYNTERPHLSLEMMTPLEKINSFKSVQ